MLQLSSISLALFLVQVVNGQFAKEDYRGPSFIFEPPRKVEFSNSTGMTVQCSSNGYPTPTVTWFKQDGNAAHDVTDLRYVRHDGSLVFPPFAADAYRADIHAAVYRCVVANNVGAISSRDVHLRAVVLQSYEIRLFDEFVLRGNMAVLRCPVPSFVSDYVRVAAWERIDGLTITPATTSGKYGMLENGDLYLRDTSEQDSSDGFRCHTENTVTKEKKSSSNYAKIIVTEPHHRQPPRVIRRSSKVTVQLGHRSTLSCVAQGHPAPSYLWQKVPERYQLPLSRLNEEGSIIQEGGVLVIRKTSTQHRGKYLCTASNDMGEENVEAELIVEEPVRVSVYPREIKADVGKTVTFNCSASVGPTAGNIIWAKDSKTLSPNSKILYSSPTTLQIRKLSRKDAGMYQCFLRTERQSEQASSRLIIGDLAPRLKVTFSEKTVSPGSFVSLWCVASGNPEPRIEWWMDEIQPLLSGRSGLTLASYPLPTGDMIGYLNISSASISDGGLYSCKATNEAGFDVHSRRLNVYGPVSLKPLADFSSLAGEEFTALCPFSGYPFDGIHWKREGRLLPVNQRQKVFPNGTLLIKEAQPGVDDGAYTCEVTSRQSAPASRTFQFVIRSRPKVSPFSFQDNLQEGMRTAVTCIVLAGDPPFDLRWEKDGQPLKDGVLGATVFHHESEYVSTLIINSLAYRHNGNYTCLATNDFATASHSALLTVRVPPRWILEPRDASAIEGHPARIDCQADGVPQPHIRWKLASGHLPENFRTIVSSSHVHILVNGSLNFRNVEATDSGFYLCEASNGVGTGLSTVVRLTVHSPPQFRSKFLVSTTRRGQRAVIECSCKGDKPIVFTWRKNNALVDTMLEPRYSEITEESADSDKAKLVIEKVERKDSAIFTCTATNDFGKDSMSIQLTVQDIPDAPQNVEVHDISSRSIRLTWNQPFDGNSPITQYTVAWRQLDREEDGALQSVPGSESTLTLRGLKPKTRYFFRVKGENELGQSQYSAEVAATTLEEPPRNSPGFVNAAAISSTSINVTWENSETTTGDNIDGFYVGYKVRGSTELYTFKPAHPKTDSGIQHFQLDGLNRYTEYSVVVQAFNGRGAGPPSEQVYVRTLEFDLPGVPMIKRYFATSTTVKLAWELANLPNAPVSGYILHHRLEGSDYRETHLTGDRTSYTLHDLKCGSTYVCYLVAFNSVGRGNASDELTIKTDGSAPLAPEKRLLLSVNSSAAVIHLRSWQDGGCPIAFFIVQYKTGNQHLGEWTLLSNNVRPEQSNVTISDLAPGTWYSLLVTARNDAGATDAEYIFGTLTLNGESPPHPSEVSGTSGSFLYRHLTITLPVACSVFVLVLLLIACVVGSSFTSRGRHSTGRSDCTADDHVEGETSKPEHVPLSVTYEGIREPAYFPTPFPSHSTQGGQQRNSRGSRDIGNSGTFGSTRSGGCEYDIPYVVRKTEKDENYEPPVIYFPPYHHIGVELWAAHAVYEVPDRSRAKSKSNPTSWREAGDGNSSTDSEIEDRFFQTSQPERVKDTPAIAVPCEVTESETECDRLWKMFEESQYESRQHWTGEREVLT